jgi:hypothetical protein
MIETENYWINSDYYIFKSEFNEKLSYYIEIIKNYKN